MTWQDKKQELKNNLFKLISTEEITFLKDIDIRIDVIKKGKFYYNCNNCTVELEHSNVRGFLNQLDRNKFYTIIPLLSVNNKMDEPYIILSKQILITRYSNSINLFSYFANKINDTIKLYNIEELDNFHIIFKYKEVDFDLNINNIHKFMD
uniref:Uncharacterized protein n=1 Tax=Lactifluus piperatus TaxID=71966 RepID=A0A2Z4M948_9AGAM|nr:hypothetical protein [Lactifluus piperatus]AWX53024.1 hypothetical protein [Lactifluus piperatus]